MFPDFSPTLPKFSVFFQPFLTHAWKKTCFQGIFGWPNPPGPAVRWTAPAPGWLKRAAAKPSRCEFGVIFWWNKPCGTFCPRKLEGESSGRLKKNTQLHGNCCFFEWWKEILADVKHKFLLGVLICVMFSFLRFLVWRCMIQPGWARVPVPYSWSLAGCSFMDLSVSPCNSEFWNRK